MPVYPSEANEPSKIHDLHELHKQPTACEQDNGHLSSRSRSHFAEAFD